MFRVLFWSVLFIFSALCSSKSKDITIAGIFNQFNADNSVNLTQMENLFAFTMAINEINRRTDILPNHHLNYILRSGIGFGAAKARDIKLGSYEVFQGVYLSIICLPLILKML